MVCGTGPLLFLNNGDGTFSLQTRRIQVRTSASGFVYACRLSPTMTTTAASTSTSACTCITSDWSSTTTRSRTTTLAMGRPIAYFAIRATEPLSKLPSAPGLNADNDRYSFACAWGDSNGNGLPDLFVANDFGSSQLYRNNGDGTFKVFRKKRMWRA